MKRRPQLCESLLEANSELMVHGIGISSRRSGRQRVAPAVDTLQSMTVILFNHDSVPAFVDGHERRLEAMSLAVWDGSRTVDYGSSGGVWRLSWLQVWGEGVDRLVEELGICVNSSCVLPGDRAALALLEGMLAELLLYCEPERELLLNSLRGLLLEFRRASSGPKLRRPLPAKLQEAKAHIDGAYMEGLRLDELARRAGMSKEHFCRKFKESFGVPPLAYAMGLRMDEVLSGMADPSLGIGELASRAGFSDMTNFSKTFKRRFGVSPSVCKERLLNSR